LPSQYQKVILLFLDKKTSKEIAQEMGISINTVKTYKLRAINILHKKFAKYKRGYF